jgi:hypothetical protein
MDALKKNPFLTPAALLPMLAAWTALSLMTGCRLGNRTVAPEDPDKITGYYETAPSSLKFCATSAGVTTCKEASTTLTPSLISVEMTNPTILAMQDLESGYAAIVSPSNTKAALPIYVTNGKLAFDGSSGAVMLWTDPACTSATYLESTGAIVAAPPKPVEGSVRTTMGRIQLKAQVIETYDGTCGPTLTQLRKCYDNVAECGAGTDAARLALQREVQSMFDPYLKSGVLTPDGIVGLTSVSYVVQYE